MLVTPAGIVTLVKLLQPENVPHSILVTPSGIVTLVSLLQRENRIRVIRFRHLRRKLHRRILKRPYSNI